MARKEGATVEGRCPPPLWHKRWAAFLRNSDAQKWWVANRPSGPLYMVPQLVLEFLGGHEGKRCVLSESEYLIETEFSRLCSGCQQDIRGVWGTEPIFFGLLEEAPPPDQIDEKEIRIWRYGKRTFEEKMAALRVASQITKEAVVRRLLLRRAGELSCTPAFIKDAERLRLAWADLANPVPFPLNRPRIAAWRAETSRLSPKRAAGLNSFLDATEVFLNRWHLTGLATWDIAIPVGQYERMPASALANLLGDPIISSVGSHHLPVARAKLDDAAAKLAWPESLKPAKRARGGTKSLYERAFEMKLWELAIGSRYGKRHGATERLLDAAQKKFCVGRNRAEQIRRAYIPTLKIPRKNVASAK